jgi:hypothetical protein
MHEPTDEIGSGVREATGHNAPPGVSDGAESEAADRDAGGARGALLGVRQTEDHGSGALTRSGLKHQLGINGDLDVVSHDDTGALARELPEKAKVLPVD